jgi:hypothetical protein
VRAVQVEDGAGGVLDFDTEEAVQKAIFNEVHRKHYNLAEEALRGQFGYTATSPTARSVLDRTYKFPPEMDAATRELFEEIAHIRAWCRWTRLTASSCKNAGNNGGRK